jgi:hypothetical protein
VKLRPTLIVAAALVLAGAAGHAVDKQAGWSEAQIQQPVTEALDLKPTPRSATRAWNTHM